MNTAQPSVTGTAVVGDRLTAENGSWTNTPTSFTYQWLQCDRFGGSCLTIAGAIHRSYFARLADAYGTLRVDVTATNASGSATRRSSRSDVVQPVVVTPTPGNKAPRLTFISLKRLGTRAYARFTVCDDAPKNVEVIERDAKAGSLSYVRRFTVVPNSCVTVTRNWFPAVALPDEGPLHRLTDGGRQVRRIEPDAQPLARQAVAIRVRRELGAEPGRDGLDDRRAEAHRRPRR